MKWFFRDVDGNPITCTVCKRRLDRPDYLARIWYEPGYATEEQYEAIALIWGIDPYADFAVCEECIHGYCGAVRGLTADRWLAEHLEAFLRDQGKPCP